jgi:hypothetical protein
VRDAASVVSPREARLEWVGGVRSCSGYPWAADVVSDAYQKVSPVSEVEQFKKKAPELNALWGTSYLATPIS